MKSTFIHFVLGLIGLSYLPLTAQNTVFQKTFLYSSSLSTKIINTTDSGFVFTSQTGNGVVHLLKMDVDGNLLWQKNYSMNLLEKIDEVVECVNGELYITGTTGQTSSVRKYYVVKLTSTGNLIWAKMYTTASSGHYLHSNGVLDYKNYHGSRATCALVTGDQGLVFAGWIRDSTGINDYIQLNRIDSAGNVLWSSFTIRAFSIQSFDIERLPPTVEADEKFYVVFDNSSHFNLAEFSSAGESVWTREYANTNGYFSVMNIAVSDDTSLVISGQSSQWAILDAMVLKTDTSGAVLWFNLYNASGAPEWVNDIAVTPDNDYILMYGNSASALHGSAGLVKMDPSGNFLWGTAFDSTVSYPLTDGFSGSTTLDGGYIFSGGLRHPNLTGDTYVVKTDSNGVTACNTDPINLTPYPAQYAVTNAGVGTSASLLMNSFSLTVSTASFNENTWCYVNVESSGEPTAESIFSFPNPADEYILINAPDGFNIIEIRNSLGQVVKTEKIINSVQRVDVSSLASGMYYLQLMNEKNGSLIQPLLVQ